MTGFTVWMDSNNWMQPFWCIIRCILFFHNWECIFNGCLRDVRGAWQHHQVVESFVHIINEGVVAAEVVILLSRLHTQPLFRRHMISSWKYAVAMVKYSITKALNFGIRVDPCSYDMVEGPHIDSPESGALVIDLIFTSKAPWLRWFGDMCDEDMSPSLRRCFLRGLPSKCQH